MLLQHLRTSEPTLEAAIAYNLVDFVLVTSEESFIGVAHACLLISSATNLKDPRFSNNMACRKSCVDGVRAAAMMYSSLHAAHAEVQNRVWSNASQS
jgi:hypothetical protein